MTCCCCCRQYQPNDCDSSYLQLTFCFTAAYIKIVLHMYDKICPTKMTQTCGNPQQLQSVLKKHTIKSNERIKVIALVLVGARLRIIVVDICYYAKSMFICILSCIMLLFKESYIQIMTEYFCQAPSKKPKSRTHSMFSQRFNTGIFATLTKTDQSFDIEGKTQSFVLYLFQLVYFLFW